MKDGSRDTTRAEPAARAETRTATRPPARDGGGISNQAIVQHLREGGTVAGFPGAPLDNQRQQGRGSLPHQDAMERTFGRSLDHLRARTGASDLGPLGARALALKDRVVFRESSPSPSVVAHEVAHALQHERGGAGAGLLAPRESAAEREADSAAALVAQQGARARIPSIGAPAGGQVHFYPDPMRVSPEQEDMLRKWIAAEAGDSGPKWDPSLPVPKSQNKFGLPDVSAEQRTMLTEWLKMQGGTQATTPTAPPATTTTTAAPGATAFGTSGTPAFGALGGSSFTHLPTSSFGFPKLDQPSHDPFKTPQFDSSVCHTNIHGVTYKREPQPPPPTWTPPEEGTARSAVSREGQTANDTVDQIDLQVLTAKSQALAAAAKKGSIPPDLQELWQRAVLSAEALRSANPELARSRPSAISSDPAAPAPVKPPATGAPAVPVPTVDADAATSARSAIDAFYWALIDVLQKREAEATQLANQINETHAAFAHKAPACPGNCHTPNGPQPEHVEPARPESPTVMERERALLLAANAADWRRALGDFDITSKVQLESLLASILPKGSAELDQLTYATSLRDRVQDLMVEQQGKQVWRIPAVFYPKNPPPGTTTSGPAPGYSWYLFLYKNKGIWTLKDLTTNQIFTNTQGGDVQTEYEAFAANAPGDLMRDVPQSARDFPPGAMKNLFGQLDSKLHMPEGMLYYTLPNGLPGTQETTASRSLGDWLSDFGLGLAILGVILLTGGQAAWGLGALAVSGLFDAAGAAANLGELEQQGIATDSDRAHAYLRIAVDIVGTLAMGAGEIARAPGAIGELSTVGGRMWVPLSKGLNIARVGLDAAQAAVMTHDFIVQIQALAALPESKDRDWQIAKLVAMGLAMGTLSFVSIRSGMKEIAGGGRPPVEVGSDGSLNVVGKNAMPKEPPVIDTNIGEHSVAIDLQIDKDGLVSSARVSRKGRLATDADVAIHEAAAQRAIERYGSTGLQGKLRQIWRRIQAAAGIKKVRVPVEVELEIWKLEESSRLRLKVLCEPGASAAAKKAATHELDVIESNLEKEYRKATEALAHPQADKGPRTAEVWKKDAPPGYPTPPKGTRWYLTAEGVWDLEEIAERGGREIRAVYNEGKLVEISNRAQLDRSRVIGRNVNDVKDRLKALGYTVDAVEVGGVARPRIRRMGNLNQGLIELEVGAGDVVREGTHETESQAQTRMEDSLNKSQAKALSAARKIAEKQHGQVVLLEGIYDLKTTWAKVIEANGGREQVIKALVAKKVSRAEATKLIDGLIANPRELQVVRGTSPLRRFDYADKFAEGGGKVPAGGEVHHGDPLYLAGSHDLLVGLGSKPHDGVHEVFNNLKLPDDSALPGTALEPNTLQNAVPAGNWRTGMATIHGNKAATPGQIDYEAL